MPRAEPVPEILGEAFALRQLGLTVSWVGCSQYLEFRMSGLLSKMGEDMSFIVSYTFGENSYNE